MNPEELARARGDPVVFVLDKIISAVRFLFRLGRRHAGADPAEFEPPRARSVPSFEDYATFRDRALARVKEPSPDPWLAGETDEAPADYAVVREPDGRAVLRKVTEPSRYRRKLIPPGSFTHDD